ncbi:50S ribosomal protein L13 [Candidatus Gugararchaeum adminiculabundum]|nr:50S ribosomal protein L13 [Candidatus Gugararchaeum adminiculabundum]
MAKQLVIDANNGVLGRIAARVAKHLLGGDSIVLVNAEKLVISGDPAVTAEKYLARRRVKNKANPEHSPKWPRRPDFLVRRVIRGMLPFYSRRGRNAFKNLRVYIGIPEEFANAKLMEFEQASANLLDSKKRCTVEQLCTRMGFRLEK